MEVIVPSKNTISCLQIRKKREFHKYDQSQLCYPSIAHERKRKLRKGSPTDFEKQKSRKGEKGKKDNFSKHGKLSKKNDTKIQQPPKQQQ